jgi:adenylate cyclase
LALDDSNTDALALLSEVGWMQHQFERAVADGERAVAVDPNYADGYRALSDALNASGRPKEALRAVETAMRLNPVGQDFYLYTMGNSYVQMGRYQEAISVLKRHLAAYANSIGGHLFMVVAYAELGRNQEARAEAAEVIRISPHFVVASLPRSKNPLQERYNSDLRKAGLK